MRWQNKSSVVLKNPFQIFLLFFGRQEHGVLLNSLLVSHLVDAGSPERYMVKRVLIPQDVWFSHTKEGWLEHGLDIGIELTDVFLQFPVFLVLRIKTQFLSPVMSLLRYRHRAESVLNLTVGYLLL